MFNFCVGVMIYEAACSDSITQVCSFPELYRVFQVLRGDFMDFSFDSATLLSMWEAAVFSESAPVAEVALLLATGRRHTEFTGILCSQCDFINNK